MKRMFLFIAAFFAVSVLSCQELKTYSGGFKGGEATYTYYENDDGRVFEGKFHWKGNGNRPGYLENKGEVEIKGSFKNNKRDGLWIYTATDKQNRVNILKANYVNGVPEGIYEYEENWGMFNEKKALSATNKNGRADGSVKIELPNSVITGNYAQSTRVGVWERKFTNGSYFHVVCKGSHIDEEIGRSWDLLNEKREGNFFYDIEDGSKKIITVGNMLYAGDVTIDGELFDACWDLETHRIDFGIVIPENLSFTNDDAPIYEQVQEKAQFPGGDAECFKWLDGHMNPDICKENKTQGSVTVSFVVNRDGSIVDVKTILSPDSSLTEEAERLVKTMPKWKPARRNNEIVRSRFYLSIPFLPQSNTQGTSAQNQQGTSLKIKSKLKSNVKLPAGIRIIGN